MGLGQPGADPTRSWSTPHRVRSAAHRWPGDPDRANANAAGGRVSGDPAVRSVFGLRETPGQKGRR
jgi:hypothetical protein